MTEDPASVQVSLPQILDLALGTPEVGSVNLSILHNFLHILLNQLNFANKNVEYRDDNANRIKNALAVARRGSCPALQAYNITNGTTNDLNAADVLDTHSIPPVDPSVTSQQTISSAAPSKVHSATPSNVPASSRPPSIAPQATPNLSEEIAQLNNRLTEFETNLLYLNDDVTELRNNLGIERQPPLNADNPDQIQKPVADVKLSGEMTTIPKPTSAIPIAPDKDETMKESSSGLTSSRGSSSISKGRSVIAGVDLVELKADVVELKNDMAQAKLNIETLRSQIDESGIKYDKNLLAEKIIAETLIDIDNEVEADDTNVQSNLSQTPIGGQSDQIYSGSGLISNGNHASSHATVDKSSVQSKKSQSKSLSIVSATGHESQEKMSDGNDEAASDDESRTELTEAVRNMEIIYSEAVRNLEFRVAELETEMKAVNNTVSNIPIGDTEGIQEIQEFITKLQDLHANIESINQTNARLSEERENRESHTNILIEQIELLKTIKADKEDLEDALADKADATIVNRKVSYDRFNNAYENLAHGVEDAITKLTQQEYIWQQSLDTVQQEIDNKLDKIEISPIRDFINNRLQILQDKIKELADKKEENEAAGTRKILTGLHCISCDKKVVMRTEQRTNYQHIAVQPVRNTTPYLTCDVNQSRKQQKKYLAKNMNQLTAAMQGMGKNPSLPTRDCVIEKASRDHLCNRYCGGSHTVTTPQQRVMRSGHFLAQWGPEAVELTPGVVRGTDGQLYQSTSMPPGASAANYPDVCGPNTNVCCGMQSPRLPTQQPQQTRLNHGSELATNSQQRSSQKEQIRSGSFIHATRRAASMKVVEPLTTDRSMEKLLNGSMISPTTPSQPVIINDKYLNEPRGQVGRDVHELSPKEN